MAKAYPLRCDKCGRDISTHAYRIKNGKYRYFCSKKCVTDYLVDEADIEYLDFRKGKVKQVWLMTL